MGLEQDKEIVGLDKVRRLTEAFFQLGFNLPNNTPELRQIYDEHSQDIYDNLHSETTPSELWRVAVGSIDLNEAAITTYDLMGRLGGNSYVVVGWKDEGKVRVGILKEIEVNPHKTANDQFINGSLTVVYRDDNGELTRESLTAWDGKVGEKNIRWSILERKTKKDSQSRVEEDPATRLLRRKRVVEKALKDLTTEDISIKCETESNVIDLLSLGEGTLKEVDTDLVNEEYLLVVGSPKNTQRANEFIGIAHSYTMESKTRPILLVLAKDYTGRVSQRRLLYNTLVRWGTIQIKKG